MSLEEYRLSDAWKKLEESMRTGKPLKENESKREKSGRGKAMKATKNPKKNVPNGYDENRNEGRMDEDAAALGMTTAGPGTSDSPVDKADPNRKQGIARFAKKLGTEGMDMGVGAASPGIGGMMAADADPMSMGADSVGAVSDIIERLKQRFPSADIKVAVQLPQGATFADAEIEAALDAVEGSAQMGMGDEEGFEGEDEDDEGFEGGEEGGEDEDEEGFEGGEDEDDEGGEDEDDEAGVPFGGEADDEEDEDEEDDEDEEGEELDENDVLDGARKPRQGPDEYLHNKGISESARNIRESEDRESDGSDGIDPCCFTMTIDQWEAFLNGDPFKRM